MRQYIIYQKICIICMNNFDTTRVNTLCCGKKCRNRMRYLPQRMINSLIEKFSLYTTVQKFGDSVVSSHTAIVGKPFTEDELRIGQRDADVLAASRGVGVGVKKPIRIKNPDASSALPEIVADNLKYINKEDPALGGSDGFGVKGGDYDNNDITKDNSSSSGSVVNNSDSNGIDEISQGRLASVRVGRGIRKLGGR